MKATWASSHIAYLSELAMLDMSASKIADRLNEKFGVSVYTKGSVLAKIERLEIVRPQFSHSIWTPELVAIFDRGVRDGLSNRVIGKLCGVNPKTVYVRIKALGLSKVGSRAPCTEWCADEDNRLEELLKTKTRAEAADALGRTRQSVIARMKRLGLKSTQFGVKGRPSRPEVPKLPKPPKLTKPPREKRSSLPKTQGAKKQWVEVPAPIVIADFDRDLALPESRRVSINELRNTTCHFPIGHPKNEGFSYCGAPGADYAAGKPYCKSHALLSYRPSQDRKREDRYILRVTQRVSA